MSSDTGESDFNESLDSNLNRVVERMRACATDGVGEWGEVNEDVAAEQKNELVSEGVIVDDGLEYRFERSAGGFEGYCENENGDGESGGGGREGVGDGVGEGDESESEFGVITGDAWSWKDKVMGVLILGFIAGYFSEPVRGVVGGGVDFVVSPVMSVLPFHVVVLVLAVVTGAYSSLLRGGATDKEELAVHRKRMKDLKHRLEAAEDAGDEERLEEMRDEQLTVMWSQVNVFKNTLRSKTWVLFLNIPVFIWMMWSVGGRGGVAHHELGGLVVPIAGQVSWTTSLVGPFSVWVVWYVLCSVVFTKIVQKNLNTV